MNAPGVAERMSRAMSDLHEKWRGGRIPKAFYLSQADWAEFTQSDWPTVETIFGNNPPRLRTDLAFNGVPVRPSKSTGETSSRLYDHSGYGHVIASDRDKATKQLVPVLPADQVFTALDKLSRTRALTDRESLALEAAMKGKVILSRREALRLRLEAA